MDQDQQRDEEAQEGNADQGSGDRPQSPEEGTSPPGNPGVDEERLEEAEEDVERTKPY